YSEEAPHLLEDAIERPGLEAAAGLYGVAMHRVTRPDDLPSLLLHPPHQLRQMLLDLFRPHACDKGDATGLIVRIQHVDEADEIIGIQGGAALHAYGVIDTTQELDVGAIQLPCAVPDPQHMSRAGVPLARQAVDPRKRLFV